MANVKRLWLLFAAVLTAGYLFLILGLMFFVKPDRVEKELIESIQSQPNMRLRLNQFHFQYFPNSEIHAKELVFEISGEPSLKLSGTNFRAKLSALPLIFGKIEIRSIALEDADFTVQSFTNAAWQNIFLTDMMIQVGAIRPKRNISIEFKAAFSDVPNAVQFKGDVRLNRFQSWKWRDLFFEGDLNLNHVILSKLSRLAKPDFPARISEGQFRGGVHLSKQPAYSEIMMHGRGDFQQIVYEIRGEHQEWLKSPSADFKAESNLSWNSESEILTLHKTAVASPAGNIEMLGRFSTNTREFKDFRISIADVTIENMPQYFPPLKKILPLNSGFSGLSEIEMSLDGSPDHLSVDANWDLTPTLLTYSRYFQKSKDVPMNMLFNCVIENGKELSGDFSIRLQNATFKGTVNHFNFHRRAGELNVITNKFQLTGWEALIPPLSGYSMEGELKVLLNWVGDVENVDKGHNILNVTLEDGSLKAPDWPGLAHVGGVLDISPFSLDLKKASLEIQGFPLELELMLYNAVSENRSYKGRIKASRFSPEAVLGALDQVRTKLAAAEDTSPWIASIQSTARQILRGSDETLLDFNADFHYQNQKLSMDALDFSAFGGRVKSKLEIDFSKGPLSYLAGLEIEKLSLARYFGTEEPVIRGNLFLNGQFAGKTDSLQSLTRVLSGQGMFSVTNGEFPTFDVLGAVGEIDGFGEVGLLSNKKTSFSDFRGKFNYGDERIKIENATMLSPELTLETHGEILKEGLLNFRMDTYLSTTLTGHFLTPILGKFELTSNRQFGPIPLLLSGPAKIPEIKTDSRQMEQLKDNLLRKKTQKILRNFVSEEAVFSPDSSDPKKKPI